MPWAKGLHTDGSPAEKAYKASITNKKKQEKVLFSKTHVLTQALTHPGKLQSLHMAPQAWSEISIYRFLEMTLGQAHGMGLSPRALIKRLQGKGVNHHTAPQWTSPKSLRVGAPRCPHRLSWRDLCPSPDLHCLSQTAHQPTWPYPWDRASLCWIPAPSEPPKIYSMLSQTASGPLPCPFTRTQCDHQPSTWGGLTTTFPLPPVFPLPFLGGRGEKLSPWEAHPSSARRDGGMAHQRSCCTDPTWGSAWAFCRVLKGSFVLFLGPHILLDKPLHYVTGLVMQTEMRPFHQARAVYGSVRRSLLANWPLSV